MISNDNWATEDGETKNEINTVNTMQTVKD